MSNLSATAESALVTTNGSVPVVLFDPRFVPGRKVTVKNGPAQAGSTSITSAGVALPDGSPLVLTGVNQSVQFESICSTPGTPSTAKWYVTGGSAAASIDSVPWSSITGTPTTLAGYGITNAVANTRALTGSGAIKIAGDNSAHDLSADRTISIADAASGVRGVIELDTDLGGTATAVNVVRLTGAANVVGIPAATALAWDSSGPSIDNVSGDFAVHLATGKSFRLYDAATLALFWNYNSGNAFVQFAGGGLGIQATGTQYVALIAAAGGDARVLADTFNVYPTAGGTPNMLVNNSGVTLNRAFLTFTVAASNPTISQLDPASGNSGGIASWIGQNGVGTDKNGGQVLLRGGKPTGTGQPGEVYLQTADASSVVYRHVQATQIGAQRVTALNYINGLTSSDYPSTVGDRVVMVNDATSVGTGVMPTTGFAFYGFSGAPTFKGSNGGLTLSLTALSTATANGGTAVATALGGASSVFIGVTFGGTNLKLLGYTT